jgi:eukaryotic-like serine/threonine-protein kinase
VKETHVNADTPAVPAGKSPAFAFPNLPRYEFLREIGKGGMGVVYCARHRHLDKEVAVKVTKPGVDAGRFRREARLLAKIASPYVVTAHDFDVLDDGSPVLVMELLHGRDLGKMRFIRLKRTWCGGASRF